MARTVCSCDKAFTSEDALAQHIATTKHARRTKYKCEYCFYNAGEQVRLFPCKSAYEAHIDAIHRTKVKWPCSFCSSVFKTSWALEDHQSAKKHVPPSTKPPAAEKLPKPPAAAKLPKQPKQTSTKMSPSKEKTAPNPVTTEPASKSLEYKCNVCLKAFDSSNKLEGHMFSKKHTPYRCRDCEMLFRKPEHLEDHMASVRHNPIGTFACGCKSEFPCPSALLQHLESKSCPDASMTSEFNHMLAEYGAQETQGGEVEGLRKIQKLLKSLILSEKEENAAGGDRGRDDVNSEDGSVNGVSVAFSDASGSWENIPTPSASSDLGDHVVS